jgi:hypothetical protein
MTAELDSAVPGRAGVSHIRWQGEPGPGGSAWMRPILPAVAAELAAPGGRVPRCSDFVSGQVTIRG